MNKLKRSLFPNVALAVWTHWDCLAGDKLQQDIRSWLSPPDPWKNYNIARGSRHSGTGRWIVQGNMLSEWKASGLSTLLWIRGKRELPPNAYYFAETDGFPLSQRALGRVYFGTLTLLYFRLEHL
jgi:hypothetical protein